MLNVFPQIPVPRLFFQSVNPAWCWNLIWHEMSVNFQCLLTLQQHHLTTKSIFFSSVHFLTRHWVRLPLCSWWLYTFMWGLYSAQTPPCSNNVYARFSWHSQHDTDKTFQKKKVICCLLLVSWWPFVGSSVSLLGQTITVLAWWNILRLATFTSKGNECWEFPSFSLLPLVLFTTKGELAQNRKVCLWTKRHAQHRASSKSWSQSQMNKFYWSPTSRKGPLSGWDNKKISLCESFCTLVHMLRKTGLPLQRCVWRQAQLRQSPFFD